MLILLDTRTDGYDPAEAALGYPVGQLVTPLTRRKLRRFPFAVDNGAFSKFSERGFFALLNRCQEMRDQCLFVAVPDVVACSDRTLALFEHYAPRLQEWPLAFVCQDGQEDNPVPWDRIAAVFIGGSTDWKCGRGAEYCARMAKDRGKWLHVGRVNTPARFDRFLAIGADSVDGTGISRYSHMQRAIATGFPLFQTEAHHAHQA